MNIRRTIGAVVVSWLASQGIAFAATPAQTNWEHGFAPEKLYQFSDVDSVNLFNGNLIVTVPVGMRYPVHAFSYQLSLRYNSKVWQYYYRVTDPCKGCVQALPHRQSNAGLGWRLSLGRLFPPGHGSSTPHSTGLGAWIYEGPSGDGHEFGPPSNTQSAADLEAPLLISLTSATLRLRNVDLTHRVVEFPNGELHHFRKGPFTQSDNTPYSGFDWRLTEIADRHGNKLEIIYTLEGDRDTKWLLKDSTGRRHFVYFEYRSDLAATDSYGANVSRIDLQTPHGQRAEYHFVYGTPAVVWPCDDKFQTGESNPPAAVPRSVLESITLPDGSAYQFTYQTVDTACAQGALQTLRVPTGATMTYGYAADILPVGGACGVSTEATELARRPSLQSKRLKLPSDPLEPEWRYIRTIGASATPAFGTEGYEQICSACGGIDCHKKLGAENPVPGPLHRWVRTTVLSPPAVANGPRTRTDHYFNIWLGGTKYADPLAAAESGYGLPYTHAAPAVSLDAPANGGLDTLTIAGGRHLSTRTFENCAADDSGACVGGRLVRSTYLQYSRPTWFGWQLDASRTVFEDDAACGSVTKCWNDTAHTQPNAVGRFGTTTVSSNFPDLTGDTKERTELVTTTEYPSWSVEALTSLSRVWLPDIYTARVRTVGDISAVTRACFNESTGFLEGLRVQKSAQATGANDLLTVFVSDKGLVGEQHSFGGDALAAPVSGCTSTTTPEYKIKNTYTHGVLSKSEHVRTGFSLLATDLTVDPVGLPLTSRDASGVATTYTYDSIGRLKAVTPPVGVATLYDYAISAVSPSVVTVRVTSGGTDMLRSQYSLDGLGRVVKQEKLIREGTATVLTTYDGLGRKRTVTEPYGIGITSAVLSTFDYDAFDRATKITAPDGSATRFAYTGVRRTQRTVDVMRPLNATATPVSVQEEYDAQGRLMRVTEGSGPFDASVKTEYRYDVGSRLTRVDTVGAEASRAQQTRKFQYDLRGLLEYEEHPEVTTKYTLHDSRGNVLRKEVPGAPKFTTEYQYDGASRLVKVLVAQPPPFTGPLRALKEYVYATANESVPQAPPLTGTMTSYSAGKLRTATRWNYDPAETASMTGTVLRVSEKYEYAEVGGRPTARRTIIESGSDAAGWSQVKEVVIRSSYDSVLGHRVGIDYPWCYGCAYTTGRVTNFFDRNELEASAVTHKNPAGVETTRMLAHNILYFSNGMPSLVDHGNGMRETRTLESSMARPGTIEFASFGVCTPAKVLSVHTSPQKVTYTPQESVVLSANATGSAPLRYQWYVTDSAGTREIPGAISSWVEVFPAQSSSYYVMVSSPCPFAARSPSVTLTVVSCVAPAITSNPAPLQDVAYGRTVELIVQASGTQAVTIQWYRGKYPDESSPVFTGSTFVTPVLTQTAYYWAKASNSCGVAIAPTITLSVPLPAPFNLVASPTGDGGVAVGWMAQSSGSRFRLERMSGGSAFAPIAEVATASFTDRGVVSGTTYVYRVRAMDADGASLSNYSNHDSSMLMTFTAPSTGGAITTAYFNELLAAVNATRAASGAAALSWPAILPESVPAPASGQPIHASHLTALRTHLDAALAAVGVSGPVFSHSGADSGFPIFAALIAELQQRIR